MSNAASTLLRAHCFIVIAAGCSSPETTRDTPPSHAACGVVRHVEVPRDLLTTDSNAPRLLPFGSRFALLAASTVATSRTVDAALVSWQGVDNLYRFALGGLCPNDVCRNVHGSALLASADEMPEFLLVEQGSNVSMAAYPFRVLAWEATESAPAETPLFEARVGAITTRSDMKSSADARRALFVSGNVDTPLLQLALLRDRGALAAAASTMPLPAAPWDCLTVVPTAGAAAISVLTRAENGVELTWSLRELGAESELVFEATAVIPVGDAVGYVDCPRVVASEQGFHAQWVSSGGNSVVATLKRDGGAAPGSTLFPLDISPGSLEGLLQGDFLFRAASPPTGRPALVRVSTSGTASVALMLPPLATSPQVLGVEGPLISLAYELDDARIFEQLECP